MRTTIILYLHRPNNFKAALHQSNLETFYFIVFKMHFNSAQLTRKGKHLPHQ
jgi:hypothetical protein